MRYLLSLLFLAFSVSATMGQSYNSRYLYDDIHSLLEKDSWLEAKILIDKNLKADPNDLALQLGAAVAAEEEIKSSALYKWEAIEKAYQTATTSYTNVMSIKGNQFSQAKPYFAKMTGDKKPSTKDLIAHCEKQISDLNIYYGELKAHKEDASMAEQEYVACLSKFSTIVDAYERAENLPIYLTASDLTTLEEIQTAFEKTKSLIKALEAQMESDSIALSPSNKIKIEWKEALVSGKNVSPTSQGDFLRQEVKVFDLANWASKVKEEGKKITELRNTLYTAIKTINQAEQDGLIPSDYQKITTEMNSWNEKMNTYDPQSNLQYLTRYYLDKGKFFALATDYKQKRETSFIHKELRKGMIQQIIQQIDTAYNSLRFIANPKVYAPNQSAILEKLGGVKQLELIQQRDDSVWMAQKSYWNGVEFASYSLDSSIPDEMSVDGKTVIMRPAKGDVKANRAAGKYSLDYIGKLADATRLLHARTKGSSMIAKLLDNGTPQWSATYSNATIVYTNDYHEGAAGYIVKASDGKMKFYLRDNAGSVVIETAIDFIPTERHKTSDGLFLVGKKNKKLHLLACHTPSKAAKTYQVDLQGKVAKTLLKDNTLYMAINYQSMTDFSGKALDSHKRSSAAVCIINADGNGNQVKTFPVDIASVISLIFEESGKVSVKGFKGNYTVNQYGSYTGGEPWEAVIE